MQLRRSLHAFYTFDMGLVEAYFRTFDLLLEERHPQLLQHFLSLGLDTDIFLVDWMYTLFTRYAAAAVAFVVAAAAVAAAAEALLPKPISCTLHVHQEENCCSCCCCSCCCCCCCVRV